MLAAGDQVPRARVWMGPRDELTTDELVEEGAVLLFFYLFDCSNRSLGRTLGNREGL